MNKAHGIHAVISNGRDCCCLRVPSLICICICIFVSVDKNACRFPPLLIAAPVTNHIKKQLN